MNSCAKPKTFRNERGGRCRPSKKSFTSLSEIVRDYIANCRRDEDAELEYFSSPPKLRAAIRIAALAINEDGKRHPHQRRIPGDTLEHFRRALTRKRKALRSSKTFSELMQISEKVAEGFWKNSKLTVYDTTLRIGAYLGIQPDRIYLHAGARKGAMALGFKGSLLFLKRSQLPKEFRKLKPYELEHCLCIYKNHLKRSKLKGGGQRRSRFRNQF
jgi:hypothetical protein